MPVPGGLVSRGRRGLVPKQLRWRGCLEGWGSGGPALPPALHQVCVRQDPRRGAVPPFPYLGLWLMVTVQEVTGAWHGCTARLGLVDAWAPDGVSEAVTAPHPDPLNFMPSAGPGWGLGGRRALGGFG